jgi:hypothetical protein
MESIETELCIDSAKSDRKGRRIRSADEWAQILERYDASGLTQEAFSRREGIRYGTLVAWLGRRRKRGGELPTAKGASPKFHELSLSSPSSTQAVLEVRLPDGTCLSGSDAEGLARLVRLLRG